MSDLARQLIEENKRTRDTFLDLGNCGLTELPDELFTLNWLLHLNLGDYYLGGDYTNHSETKNTGGKNRLSGYSLSGLEQLTGLQELSLRSNQLRNCDFLSKLFQLQILDLSDNQLDDVQFLEKLTQLQILDLTNNRIKNIHALEKLTRLRTLNLTQNRIDDIRSLENLNQLQTLSLVLNQIKNVRPLGKLTQLRILNLILNQIKDIRPLGKLTQLQTLTLSSNQIRNIRSLEKLTQLKVLQLSSNQIKYIGSLEKLTQLQALFLSFNQIKDIGSLVKLIKLRGLYLKSNQIKDTSFLKNLIQLQVLDLSYNHVTEFSGEILQACRSIHTLYLSANPIGNIPKELFDGDYKNALLEIQGYFASKEQGSIQNDEVKLIVLGNTTAGKTSLIRFVREGKYESSQNSTHGIALNRWSVPDNELKVNIWDFGGQEYYHATHRLFLDDHAVYVVVWEVSTNNEQIVSTDIYLSGKRYKMPLEHFSYSYWLDSVRYYAASSPILLVQNKTDKTGMLPIPEDCFKPVYSVHQPAYYLSIDQANAHKEILSSPHWTTFQNFKTNLINALQASAATYELGNGWVAIRDAIRQVAETRRWMTYAEFEAFCQQAVAAATPPLQFNSAVEMSGLLTYLRGAASTIVYYADDAHLRNIVFLNPQWVTDTIYDILSYDIRDREINKGEFTRAEVEAVLDEKRIGGLTDTFLDLMKKDRFELIFDKPNYPGEYIAPQYLPDTFHDSKVLEQLRPESPISFILHYPRFMPKSIFMRFMVRYGDLVHDAYWKYGIVLGKPSQRAVAECQFSERKISVQLADGAKARARDYFETLWKISAEKPEVEVSVNGTDFVPIGDLMDSLNQVPKIKSKQGNWVTVEDFYHLFGKERAIERKEPLETKVIDSTTPEIFFSYAWGDEHEVGESRETIVNELYESLKMDGYQVVRDKMDLGYKGLISGFIDRIGKGNIVIVVISDKYLKSPYCMFELLEIYRNARFEKGEFANAIFPVRVESLALNDPEVVDSYYEYWEDKEKKWHDLISKRRVNTVQTDTYHKVRKINNEFGDLIGHVSDMNTLTKELISKDNFAEIKKAIKARIESLE